MLVDWCSLEPCRNGGRCVRTAASFYCLCLPGWSGSFCDNQNLPCREAATQIGEGECVADVCASWEGVCAYEYIYSQCEPSEGVTEHVGFMGCVAKCVWLCGCVTVGPAMGMMSEMV